MAVSYCQNKNNFKRVSTNLKKVIQQIYSRLVLSNPLIIALIMLSVLAGFAFQARDFKLDASADTLLLDDDKDLKLFRELAKRYSSKEFLFVTFNPNDGLFNKNSIELIQQLRDELVQYCFC